MKRTILSEKELNLLERLVAKYGDIVTFDQIYGEVCDRLSREETYNLTTKLSKNGWLVRVKRGIYVIADLASHSFASTSPLIIGNLFLEESYVSFEAALNYYGLFDQLVRTITSISTSRSKRYQFQDLEYKFIKVKRDLFFGYKDIAVEGHSTRVAELEKIILDYLYLRNDTFSIDLVLEKLRGASKEIDFEKLIRYAGRYTTTVKRRLGFLLDIVGVGSAELLEDVKGNTGYSRLTNNSKRFNAKWRVYFEDRFTE